MCSINRQEDRTLRLQCAILHLTEHINTLSIKIDALKLTLDVFIENTTTRLQELEEDCKICVHQGDVAYLRKIHLV
jgi:hypothetical protein